MRERNRTLARVIGPRLKPDTRDVVIVGTTKGAAISSSLFLFLLTDEL